MAYTTAITNRDATDYFNFADWERIYENSRLTSALVKAFHASSLTFDVLAALAITTDPSTFLIKVNILLANIERMRLAVVAIPITGTTTEIKDDWIAGGGQPVPNYIHVNLWESTVDVIWIYFNGAALDVCPTLTANLTIPTGTQYFVFDCIDPDVYEIIIQGTGELLII